MRVILTRHYRTQSNAAGRILGWGDSPPCLDWNTDVDFVLKQLQKKEISIDAVYSSDLDRACQTAMTYAESLGVTDINCIPELKEINYGKLQSLEKTWVIENYPQHKKDPDLVYPEGESFRQMQRRSVGYLSAFTAAHPGRTVLIVSHAGVIRGLVSHFLGLEYARCLMHRISFRYIGDFLFEASDCVRYDELGKPSGFVSDGVIKIPLARSTNPG